MTTHYRNRKEKQDFWKTHVESWQQSNLTQAEYCRRNSLSIKSFGYRKRRILVAPEQSLSFVPVTIQAEPVTTVRLESPLQLVLLNGLKVEIADDFNPVLLKKLIRTAETL